MSLDRRLKRALDVTLALLGLIVGAPLMALIALLVRIDSPGRAIFSQPRLGLQGRMFLMHKFRKFPENWGTRGSAVTVVADARMTRLGRFLERTKLDELPQLWNILRGEMSFVGPRPETLNFKDLFVGEFARVHDYVPGIFGPNQVAFRNESHLYPPDQDPEIFYRRELFPRKARNDLEYFARATVLSDLLWILRGLWVSLVGAVDWRRLVRRTGRLLVLDLMTIEAAWLGANLLRFEGLPQGRLWDVYVTGTWLIPLVILSIMILGGVYRRLLRHFSAVDAMHLGSSVAVGWALGYLLLMMLETRQGSLGVGFIAMVLTLLLMGAPRVLYREYAKQLGESLETVSNAEASPMVIVLYGAGHRGAALANLLNHGFPNARVAGFLDDNDRDLAGRHIAGYPILGSERDLDTVQAVHGMHQMWLTFEPNRFKYQRLKEWCGKNAVRLIVLPITEPFRLLYLPVDKTFSPETEPLGLSSGIETAQAVSIP
jgi:lipopolysaccharide/colanic/teichoic acid biosynthesis glycosyltransferase